MGHSLVCYIQPVVDARAERVLVTTFFREVRLKIEPHEPQEGIGSRLARVLGLHDQIMKLAMAREMKFCNLLSCVAHHKNKIDWVRAGGVQRFDFVQGVWFFSIIRTTFQNGFEARCILELLVSMGVLTSLKRRNGMICTKLSSHLRKD